MMAEMCVFLAVHLTVLLCLNKRVEAETIQVPVEKYKDQTLECSVDLDDISQVTVSWSTELEDGFVRQVATGTTEIAPYVSVLKTKENDWNLRIKNITNDRDGIYVCTYMIQDTSTEARRYNISIIPVVYIVGQSGADGQLGTSFTERNDDDHDRPGVIVTKAKVGESIDMKCRVDDYNYDMGKVAWYKIKSDGKELKEDLIAENMTTYTRNTSVHTSDNIWILTLSGVDKTFGGRYVCKINEKEYAIYDVDVKDEVILVEPQHHHQATLTCVFHEPLTSTQIQRITWRYGQRQIFAGDKRKFEIRTTMFDSTLTIKRPTTGESNGNYTCRLDNQPLKRCKFEVRVQTLPLLEKHLSSPSLVTANEGDTLNLTCVMNGQPEPEIKWWRKQNVRDAVWEETGVKGSILILPDIKRYAGDEYICIGQNTNGETIWKINVTVKFGPEVTSFEDNVAITLQQPVQLSCLIQSSTKPTMHWYLSEQRNRPIDTNYRYNVLTPMQIEGYPAYTMTLELRTPGNKEDYLYYIGSYECHAKLDLQTVYTTIRVIDPDTEPRSIPDVEVRKTIDLP